MKFNNIIIPTLLSMAALATSSRNMAEERHQFITSRSVIDGSPCIIPMESAVATPKVTARLFGLSQFKHEFTSDSTTSPVSDNQQRLANKALEPRSDASTTTATKAGRTTISTTEDRTLEVLAAGVIPPVVDAMSLLLGPTLEMTGKIFEDAQIQAEIPEVQGKANQGNGVPDPSEPQALSQIVEREDKGEDENGGDVLCPRVGANDEEGKCETLDLNET
ncbi:hypothetical protein BU24DRAFT_427268, partial [Aaosphaeria arxii CBS 175.79]